MKSRLYYFDNAKFFLIISVILGHLLQNNGLSDSMAVGLFDTIFMFAMPVFVFISGIFTFPPKEIKRGGRFSNLKFWLSEFSLVETLIIFSLMMKLPVLITSGMSFYEFLLPGYTLWYLLALVWWRLFMHILPGVFLKQKYLLLVVSILISLLSGFLIRGELFALPRTLFFLPFFVAGFCVSDKRERVITTIKRLPKAVSIFIILILLTINIFVGYNQFPFNTGNVPYYNWEMDLFHALIWRVVFTMLCVIISVAVLRLIPDKQSRVSEFGANTIVLYVYHAVILFYINLFTKHFGLQVNTYIAIIEFLAVVPILILMSKSKLANELISPLTCLIKRKMNL